MPARASNNRRRSLAYMSLALLLAGLCLVWVTLAVWMWSSPTAFNAEETSALTSFVVRALGDSLPETDESGDTIYIYGFAETDDNVESSAIGVRRVYSDLIADGHNRENVKILMFDILNDGSKADKLEKRLPNFSGSKKLLQLIRSPPDANVATRHLPHPPVYPDSFEIHPWKHSTCNTLREAKAAISHSHTARAIIVVAPAFHLPRVFLTTLSAASSMAPHLHVYAAQGLPLRWDETVAHSQGLLVGDRESILNEELERLFIYNQKGDLMKPSQALQVIRKRDRSAAS